MNLAIGVYICHLSHPFTKKMYDNNLVDSTDHFSQFYLNRCSSYYRTIKALGRDAGRDAVIDLGNSLAAVRAANDNEPRQQKPRQQISTLVYDELARAITRNNTIANEMLDGVIGSLQNLKLRGLNYLLSTGHVFNRSSDYFTFARVFCRLLTASFFVKAAHCYLMWHSSQQQPNPKFAYPV